MKKFKKRGLIWLLMAPLMLLAVPAIHDYDVEQTREVRADGEMQRIDLVSGALASVVVQVASTAQVIANFGLVKDFIQTDAPEARQLVERTLSDIVSARGVYSQLRVISPAGNERLRVDLDGDRARVQPVEQLQNKLDRYYVSDALVLEPGQVYISRLDLNMEKGEIEEPLNPMLRVVSGIYIDDRLAGLLVLNYKANHLLQSIRRSAHGDSGSDIWLLNRQGYWLHSSGSEQVWGFMYEDRLLENVPARYPEVWALFTGAGGSSRGQQLVDNQIYTWEWIEFDGLLQSTGLARSTVDVLHARDSGRWLLATRVPVAGHPLTVANFLNRHGLTYLLVILVALTFMVFIDRAFESVRQERLKHERSNRRFEDLTDNHRIGVFSLKNESIEQSNHAFAQILRVSGPRAVIGMTLHDLGFPGDVVSTIRNALNSDIEVNIDAVRLVQPDGRMLWLKVSSKAQLNASGDRDFIAEDITEKKTIQDLELEHSQQLAMAGQLSGIGYWTLDVDTEALSWSETMYTIHGRDAATFKLSYANAVDCLEGPQRKILRGHIAKAIASGVHFDDHLTVVRPDGERRGVIVHGVAMKDVTGTIERVFGVYQDVTDQVALRAELDETQRQVSAVFDQSLSLMGLLDAEGRVLRVNAPAAAFMGGDSQAVTGRPFLETPLGACLEGLLSGDTILHRALKGESGAVYCTCATVTGDLRTLHLTFKPIGSREAPGVIIVEGHDITELKQQERALLEAEERLRTVLDTINDAIVTTDVRGIIQSFSEGAQKMFGYSAGEALGQNVALLMPEEMAARHDRFMGKYQSGEGRQVVDGEPRELQGRRADGTVFPLEISLGACSFGGEQLLVGAMRDLSERKKTEEQLFQAQKMDAVGKLTGGIAHDFNNLLTVILGNIQLVARKTRGDEFIESKLKSAENATRIGADLTRRLLAYSRQQDLEFESVDVNLLLDGLRDILLRTIGENIELNFHLNPDPCYALIDQRQLETAVLNLVINARDALKGTGEIKVETSIVRLADHYAAARVDLAPGEYVLVSVSDSGPGMSSEIRERIFEPFFTTKESGKGTGLGLSMVYGFVKQCSGHIDVYSEPGLGTAFKLYLPVAEDIAAPKREEKPQRAVGGTETVLVVEDEADVRAVSVSILKDLGYSVLEAEDGEQGLGVVASDAHIDLLFTDIIMPGMRGTDLAREARKLRPDLKVLFTSGYTEKAFQASGIEFAHESLLSKPFHFDSLAMKIRAALDRGQAE